MTMDELELHERVAHLEELLGKYVQHIEKAEGATYLGEQSRTFGILTAEEASEVDALWDKYVAAHGR
jgi:hypothetical protein